MRTIVYVDGFNLYYGALKGTPYKWLDLSALFRNVLKPHHQILEVKYYTARVSGRANNQSAPQRQDSYLRAIKAHCANLSVIEGQFLAQKVRMAKAAPPHGTVEVIKTEEKGSDVNLAVHLLNDAWEDRYDCAVVVSNDSDLAEALRIVKTDRKKRIILLVPGSKKDRYPNSKLKNYAMFTTNIEAAHVAACQLPNPIPGTTIHKPPSW